MKNVNDILEERAGLIHQAREIYDKAANEKREPTAEERKKFDELMNEVEGLRQQAELGDVENELSKSQGRRAGLQRADSFLDNENRCLRPDEIRFLKPDEKLSTIFPPKDQALKNVDLGRMVLLSAGQTPHGDCEAERRALSAGSDVSGGFTLGEAVSSEIWDFARNKSICLRAGARTILMNTPTLRIPKISQDVTAEWKIENVSATETDIIFAAINLRPRVVFFWLPISVELTEDSQGLDAVIRNAMAEKCALALDFAALFGGDTAEEPMGIWNDPDIVKTSVGGNGYWDNISDSLGRVENNNLVPSAVLVSPRSANLLRRLKDGEGRYMPIPSWCPPLLISKQVKDTLGAGSNKSCVITGAFENLVFAVRSPFRLEVLREAAAQKYQVVIMGAARLDCAVVREQAFDVVKDVTESWL